MKVQKVKNTIRRVATRAYIGMKADCSQIFTVEKWEEKDLDHIRGKYKCSKFTRNLGEWHDNCRDTDIIPIIQ